MNYEAKELLRHEIEAQMHRLLDKIEILNDLIKVLFSEV